MNQGGYNLKSKTKKYTLYKMSQLQDFVERFLKKLDTDKPFNVCLGKERDYVSRKMLTENNVKQYKTEGGFLNLAVPIVDHLLKGGSGLNGPQVHTSEGGLLPLAALLPMIFSGLAAAGSVAGGVAQAVKAGKDSTANDAKLAEEHRHNLAMEKQAARGDGIFLEPYKGKALKDIFEPVIDKIETLFDKVETLMEKQAARGDGIFLEPYKGNALKDILAPVIDKIDGLEQDGRKHISHVIESLKPFFKIYEPKDGTGIFLEPRRY